MSADARTTVAHILGRTTRSGIDYEGPYNIEDWYPWADRIVAALGLDDLEAAVERGAAALAAEQYPSTRWPDEFENADNIRADAEAVLIAVLSP